jgi:hypothetical protein
VSRNEFTRETSKLKGLKAHDYHVFMQQILPFCIHTLMSRSLQLLLMCMTKVFKRLCAKNLIHVVWLMTWHKKQQSHFVVFRKKIPAFLFNIMTHLMVHLLAKVQRYAYSMNVPHGEVQEVIENFCSQGLHIGCLRDTQWNKQLDFAHNICKILKVHSIIMKSFNYHSLLHWKWHHIKLCTHMETTFIWRV